MGVAPSIPTDPSRKIEVIGAGYMRTGTLSFTMACQKLLDGPAWHGGAQVLGREDAYVKKWVDCYKYRHDKPRLMKLLREATAGFVATADFPTAQFAPELLELYPDAVVVCVTRDPGRWWKSMEAVASNAQTSFLDVLLLPCPSWRWWSSLVRGVHESDGEHFGEPWKPGMFAPGPDHMAKHTEWLKRAIPKEKLFFMEIKDGWEPLCRILNKPIPKEPFPHANDAEAAESVFKGVVLKAALVWVGIFITTGVIGATAWRAWKIAGY